MLEKSCGWWLIWYLLFICYGGAEGQLQWVVKEKVAAYGQNLILFCPVENCCSEPAGWSVGTKSIILDVKTFSNDPKGKYHETYNKDGFGVVIRNLSEADLNVTYYCVYGFDLSTPKYLLHGDVFKESTDEEIEDLYNTDNQTENEQDVPDKDKDNDTAAIVVPIVVIMVAIGFIIGIVYCVYRSRKKRRNTPVTKEETEDLNPSHIQQQVTKEETEDLNPSHIQQQGKTYIVTKEETEDLNPSHIQQQGKTYIELTGTCNISQSTKLLVAAIDFGTTYSGYAFSFRDDFEQDPCKVSSPTWTVDSGGLVTLKTPTSILLNLQEEFVCFGYEAEDKYIGTASKHEWYYFRRFKQMLHVELDINRNAMVKTVDGKKELPVLTILSMVIKFMKDHLMKTLKKRATTVRKDDIQWVLTVPTIWNDSAKQLMREAAQKAGIDEANLILALEPEAASMFCKHMFVAGGTDSSQTFQPGSKYIVLDCGGGNVDSTVHQVQEDKSLKELYKASGSVWGEDEVGVTIRQMLTTIIGEKTYSNFCNKHTADFVAMFREFELKKKGFCGNEELITIKIPVSLNETFEEESGKKIQDVCSQTSHSENMKWASDKLRMTPNFFETLFEVATKTIIKHLDTLLKEPQVKGTTNIILVGGFSESSIIQTKVKEGFPKMTVIIPAEAGLSVLKGAVIFGHISLRKAK